ncbi:MAG: hypothetical protein JO043_04050 [Candidatus Eremiobacteraeota bacterium]|nr:hypothetical protein [Candidatus Eremiobacteraeota bacterium]
MSIYRVIDKLENYVREGTWLPFGMRVLSEERLIEFIEKMRSTLPEEVGRAKVIATNKERVIREAQERAQSIVDEATTAHSQLVDQSEIVRQARATAEVVLREAEEKAQRIQQGADGYAAQLLAELENRLSSALGSVRKGQDALTRQRPGATVDAPLAEAAAKTKRVAFDAQNETLELPPVEITP